jgi:hypothetical protein
VGKVECIEISGLDLWFNSSDHFPPHIHVRKRGAWEIRVFFMTSTETYLDASVKWVLKGRGPTSNEAGEILRRVLRHRTALYGEWEKKVSFDDPRQGG